MDGSQPARDPKHQQEQHDTEIGRSNTPTQAPSPEPSHAITFNTEQIAHRWIEAKVVQFGPHSQPGTSDLTDGRRNPSWMFRTPGMAQELVCGRGWGLVL